MRIRYEWNEGRQGTQRAGSYERDLHTKVGEVKLKTPKLRRQTPDRSPGQALRDGNHRALSMTRKQC
ncbi:hypothetical protein GCM10011316_36570 [Roseibium aquae]|uniref:Uncharacterized protein n=1 Tax=Roseibium aquae TaxID=1323746 RepID=A0A916X3D1_9HYPH|nr:hypothetical protein GCM10011316_36570 [Roseibium aquae]